MSPTTIDAVTRWVFLAPLMLWGPWELFLLHERSRGAPVRTISMEAARLAYGGLSSVTFFVVGLSAHFWLSFVKRPTWTSPLPGIAFWLLGAAYVALDAFVRGPHQSWPDWLEVVRWPPVVFGVAALAGHFLFPQRAPWVP